MPELPRILESYAGAFEYVIVVSPQVLSATFLTLNPMLELLLAKTERVAFPTGPPRFCTLKRR